MVYVQSSHGHDTARSTSTATISNRGRSYLQRRDGVTAKASCHSDTANTPTDDSERTLPADPGGSREALSVVKYPMPEV